MLRNCLLFIFLFFFNLVTDAQSLVRDSLMQALASSIADTNRVNILNSLGFEYRYTKPDTSYILAQEAYKLAQNLRYRSGEARALATMAAAYKFLGDYPKSLKLYNQAKELNFKINDIVRVAVILNNTADLYMQQGDWPKALATMKECYTIYDPLPEPNAGSRSIFLTNLADCFYNLGQLDSAIIYLNKALLLVKTQKENILSAIFNILGDVASAQNKASEARSFYQQSIAVSIAEDRYSELFEGYFRLSKLFKKINQPDSTLYYAKRSLTYAQKANYANGILKSSQYLSSLYDGKNNTEALKYYKIAVETKDSLYSQEKVKQLLSVNFEEKEQSLLIEAARVEYENKIKLSILIGALLIFVGIVFALYRNNRQKQKANLLLETQRDEINKKSLQLQESLETLESAQVLLKAKNAENELLMKEIHHRVKNNLEIVSSLMMLQSAQIHDPSVQEAMLSSQNRVHSMGIIHQKLYQNEHLAAVEMRDYFIDLSDNILNSFNAEGHVKVECDMPNLVLDVDTAISIGLITNELLTNSLKYAFLNKDKGNIKIILKEQETEGNIILKIADDGIGKPLNGKAQGTGFGTQLINLLTKQLDGELKYEVNNGTIVSLIFKKRN